MGPKKDAKNAVEEPPKEVEPEPLPHELVGYGRYEYLNGVVYEGNWKLIKGAKVKHGFGKMTLPLEAKSQAGEEWYEGNWQEDRMEGFGTYTYPDGSAYCGQWLDNKHHGRGKFSFANGTHYQGEWKDHLMHGYGIYVDHLGRKWEGQFREGVFESRKQMQLSKEKVLGERSNLTKEEIKATVAKMIEVLESEGSEGSEQKIALYFAASEHVKTQIKGDLLTFASKTKEQWKQLLKQSQNGQIKILQRRSDCKTINPQRLLIRQQQGQGQISEIFFSKASTKTSLLFLQVQKSRWILAALNENLS